MIFFSLTACLLRSYAFLSISFSSPPPGTTFLSLLLSFIPRRCLSLKSFDHIAVIGFGDKVAGDGTPAFPLLRGGGAAPELHAGLASPARGAAGHQPDHPGSRRRTGRQAALAHQAERATHRRRDGLSARDHPNPRAGRPGEAGGPARGPW